MTNRADQNWPAEETHTITPFTSFVPFVISCPNCGNPHQTSAEMALCLATESDMERARR